MSEPYSVQRPSKSRGDAVRLFCMECMGASVDPGFECRPWKEVRACPNAQTCALWPYRLGGPKQPVPAAGHIEASKTSRTRRELVGVVR